MPKETKKGGKRIPHPKGYIDKGLLYKGHVYPLFSDKQSDKTWILVNSIKSKNIKKKDLDFLKGLLKDAFTDRERETVYIRFYKERGISEEVTETVLQLANNRKTDKFITGSSDEFQDFNKIIRGKVFLRVIEGQQETVPKIEEVSGQGIPKSKTIPKIEEPGDEKPGDEKETQLITQPKDFNEYIEFLKQNKILTQQDVDKIKKDGFKSYLGGLLDNIATVTGLKVGVKQLTNNFANTALIAKSLIELNNVLRGRRVNVRIQDFVPLHIWGMYHQSFSELKQQEKLPLIKDKEGKEDVIILDTDVKKTIKYLNTLSTDKVKDAILKASRDGIRYSTEAMKDEAMKEAIRDTPPEPVGQRDTFGAGDPAGDPNIRIEINETTPPSPKAKQGETAEDVSEQIQERLIEQEGTSGYAPTTSDKVGLDMDNVEDFGIHNEAIQRIATMNDYDFSFTKKSLLQVNPLPNDKNELRKMGEKCIREYGFLLGVLKPKDNFSRKEVEELYTLKHILKQVIRLEAQYKRALLKMRVSESGGVSNQLDKLMSEGQLGLVLNAGSLNISPQQAVEQSSTSPILPQETKQGIEVKSETQKPQMNVFEEMGVKKKKKKKKGRLNMEYQDKRKAMLREPKNIVFKGRIKDPPLYQNLRGEAERLNQNPVPLAFKSNPNMNRMRRFNVPY